VDLEFSLLSGARKLFGQLVLQLDDRAVRHDDILKALQFI